MKALLNYFFSHKYKLVMYAMLGIATIVCVILVQMRMKENYEDNLNYYYSFMLRNLSLAWIPLLIALITYHLKFTHKLLRVILPFICLIWLIFFPNAPYLLTDFQHIRLYTEQPEDLVRCEFAGLVCLYGSIPGLNLALFDAPSCPTRIRSCCWMGICLYYWFALQHRHLYRPISSL